MPEKQQSEHNEASPARILSTPELVVGAKHQFAGQLKRGELTQGQVEQFVEERVKGVKVNGVDVISLDIHAGDHTVDPMIKAYMASDKTRVNVIEYFEPEMQLNNVYKTAQPFKTLRNYGRSMRGKPPLDEMKSIWSQLEYGQKIAEASREAGKPVAAIDIADRTSFAVAFASLRMSPMALYAGLMLTDAFPNNPAGLVVSGSWQLFMTAQMIAEKGIYSKDKATSFDRKVVDFEQARRFYLGKGVEQITKDMKSSGEEDQQVVVLYPKAHGIQMIDTITHPNKVTDKLKSGIYKSSAPWLNYAVRTWEHKGDDSQGPESLNGWVQTAKKRISV